MRPIIEKEFMPLLSTLIKNYGTVETPEQLRENLQIIENKMISLGFETRRIIGNSKNDILVATRQPIRSSNWLGLYGHYDVELIEPGWITDPLALIEKEGRIYGRGTGDNLGPLSLRLAALKEREREKESPGLFWLLQGEEEIASPFAHQEFPNVEHPEVLFWLEETGYFDHAGKQRFLVKNKNHALEEVCRAISKIASERSVETYEEERFLNKAFGQSRCPFLNHIVKDEAYIAIGPNDDMTAIHAPNESIPLYSLGLFIDQFNLLLDVAACHGKPN